MKTRLLKFKSRIRCLNNKIFQFRLKEREEDLEKYLLSSDSWKNN